MAEAEKGTTGATSPSSDMERAKHRLEEERRAAGDLAREAKGAAGSLGERAKHMAAREGEELRGEAVSHLRNFAEAVRHAGDELGEKEPGVISEIVREAAHGLERFTDTLARKQPSEVFGAMRDFGQRHPGTFLAGSMLVGFALTRLVTTQAPRRSGEHHGSDYGYRDSGPASGYGSAAYPGAGAGTGLDRTGIGGTARSPGTTSGSASADVARTGAAHPSSAGTTGMAYGPGGSGTPGVDHSPSPLSSTGEDSRLGSRPSGTAGVGMGGPGQGMTGAPASKPSTSSDTKPGGQ